MTREEFVAAMHPDQLWAASSERLSAGLAGIDWSSEDVQESMWRAVLAEKPPDVSIGDFALRAMFNAALTNLIVRGEHVHLLRFLDAAFGTIDYGPLLPQPAPRRGGVYFIQAGTSGPIKIGTARNAIARMEALQISCSEELRLLAFIPGDQIVERALHREFRADRMRGEWFEPSPALLARIAILIGDPSE